MHAYNSAHNTCLMTAPANLADWASRSASLNSQLLGRSVRLSDGGCVAERTEGGLGKAVVYTEAPIAVGKVWRITVLGTSTRTGSREGLGLGLTSAQPIHHVPDYLPCGKASEHEWYYSAQCLYHNRRSHYFPDLPSLSGLTPGQTVGLLVTAGGELHLFLDGRHRKKIASGLPVHTPLWGAADVYGTCTKIKSEILNSPGVMMRMGPGPHLCSQPSGMTEQMGKPQLHTSPPYSDHHPPIPARVHDQSSVSPPYMAHQPSQVCDSQPTPVTEVYQASQVPANLHNPTPPLTNHHNRIVSPPPLTSRLNHTVSPPPLTSRPYHTVSPPPLASRPYHTVSPPPLTSRHNHTVSPPPLTSRHNHTLHTSHYSPAQVHVQPHSAMGGGQRSDVDALRQRLWEQEAEMQRLQKRLQRVEEELREKEAGLNHKDVVITKLRAELNRNQPLNNPQPPAYWQVSSQEVVVREDRMLGTGAWGKVCKGYFRGQEVAVKCVHNHIMAPKTRERICREISTMAQVRHPHLVLFIAAVLDDHSGPKIITEIMDISLRSAYESRRLGENKLRVFRDVAAAMNYLHGQRDPIIHRDLNSANVLLEAMAGNVWKAKVSDFGSANLVRIATTPGEGSIVYTAPEAFPLPPNSHTPRPAQTTKIDVYSYGVVLCEVSLARFPDLDHFGAMVEEVKGVWPAMYRLIQSCIKTEPRQRPKMADILKQLATMNQ